MKKVKEIFLKEFNKIVREMNEEEFGKLMKAILKDIKDIKREDEENE